MNCEKFNFTRHAIEQMFARNITTDEVKEVIRRGEKIASYPDDQPYPSHLILFILDQRPLHVVVAVDSNSKTCIIITVYEPSLDLWEDDFKTRKK